MKIETAIAQVMTEANQYDDDEAFHSHEEVLGTLGRIIHRYHTAIGNGRPDERRALKELAGAALVAMRDLT